MSDRVRGGGSLYMMFRENVMTNRKHLLVLTKTIRQQYRKNYLFCLLVTCGLYYDDGKVFGRYMMRLKT